MIGFSELSRPWQGFVIATYTAVVLLIVLNAIWIVPPIWRKGLAITRVWLTPDRPKVVSIEQRRRQLDAAAMGRVRR